MKFALLVATAAAIQVEKNCVSEADAKEGFNYVDSNHNG